MMVLAQRGDGGGGGGGKAPKPGGCMGGPAGGAPGGPNRRAGGSCRRIASASWRRWSDASAFPRRETAARRASCIWARKLSRRSRSSSCATGSSGEGGRGGDWQMSRIGFSAARIAPTKASHSGRWSGFRTSLASMNAIRAIKWASWSAHIRCIMISGVGAGGGVACPTAVVGAVAEIARHMARRRKDARANGQQRLAVIIADSSSESRQTRPI